MQALLVIGAILLAIVMIGYLFMFLGYCLFFLCANFLAICDYLFGGWRFVTPPVSWALVGFFIGTILYFAIKESGKLSRPGVQPMLVVICCPLLFLSSVIFACFEEHGISSSAYQVTSVRSNEWVVNGNVERCDTNDRSILQSGNDSLCYRATSSKKVSGARIEYLWSKDNVMVCRNVASELNYSGNVSRCSRYFDPGSYEVQVLVNGEVKDRAWFSVSPPETANADNKFKGVIHNEDSAKVLYIRHPDTDSEVMIGPSQHSVIEVSKIPDNIEARFEGQRKTTHYKLFKKQGRYEGMDVTFSASIQPAISNRVENDILNNTSQKKKVEAAPPSGIQTVGKYRGVVVNENNKTLYLYHPDSGDQLTVGAGQYIILKVDRIPEQIKGVYDMSLSRQTSFNFKIHKKRGNYRGTEVEFGARVNDPKLGS